MKLQIVQTDHVLKSSNIHSNPNHECEHMLIECFCELEVCKLHAKGLLDLYVPYIKNKLSVV